MSIQVAPVRTTATPQDLAAALTNLWPTVVGGAPTREAVTTLVTQSDLETGFWHNMWNWNVGNLAGKAHDYTMLHASDGNYRPYWAFASLADGAASYLKLMASRYGDALAAASSGDLAGFASALKAKGYYEEPESSYLAAMQSRYATIARALSASPSPQPSPAPFDWGRVALVAVGGVVLGGAAYLVTRAPQRPARGRRLRRAYA